jgi:hypothetical protein
MVSVSQFDIPFARCSLFAWRVAIERIMIGILKVVA